MMSGQAITDAVVGSKSESDVVMTDAYHSKSAAQAVVPGQSTRDNETHNASSPAQSNSDAMSSITLSGTHVAQKPEVEKDATLPTKAEIKEPHSSVTASSSEPPRKELATTTIVASSTSHSPMTGVQKTTPASQLKPELPQSQQANTISTISRPVPIPQNVSKPQNIATQQIPSTSGLLTAKTSTEPSVRTGGLTPTGTIASEPSRDGVLRNTNNITTTTVAQTNTPNLATNGSNTASIGNNALQTQRLATTIPITNSTVPQAGSSAYKPVQASSTTGTGPLSNGYSITSGNRATGGNFLPVVNRAATTAGTPPTTTMRPMTTPAAQAQAQYNLALQARAAALAAQGQAGHPQQQYIRTQPVSSTPRPPTYVKPESQPQASHTGLESMKLDGASKDVIDEAESERTRLENRERKKRWREANEDRNKDNDLRCRVNKRAHKLYGKEPSKAKDIWIEEEFSKRKSKRQEKEGKGPDGNLLIEGTDLTSLNHFEMNSVIMSTLSEFATNPAAPALKDNADLNSLLHKLRTEPQVIKALFTGQPKPNSVPPPASAFSNNALTSDNIQKMDYENGNRQTSSAPDDDEDEDDKFSQNGSITNSVVDMTAGTKEPLISETDAKALTGTVHGTAQASAADSIAARRFSTSSNDGTSQHLTYGIGSGFEPQVALALSSELFRLISMQPEAAKPKVLPEVTRAPVASIAPSTIQLPKNLTEISSPVIETSVKQEIQT